MEIAKNTLSPFPDIPRRVSTFLAVMPVERSAYFSPMEEVADMEKAECTDIAIGRGKFSVGSLDARSEEETDANCFSLCDIDLSVEKGGLACTRGLRQR